MRLRLPAILLALLALASCNSAQLKQLREENDALKAENHKLLLERNAYAAQVDSMGLKDVLKVYQDAYDRYMK